jgi:hypothetical protein
LLLLLRRLVLLVLHILLVLLMLLLLRLLVSYPRKGRIPIIFSMSRLASSWMLHHVPDTLLLLMLNLCQIPGKVIIPATTSRACSLPGRIVLAGTLVADMPVTLAGIFLRHRLLSGDCRIIHLDLLILAARGYTSGTPGVMMRGRGLAPRPHTGTTHRRNVLGCADTWVRPIKGLLLLTCFRQKMVEPGLLLTQCFTG